MTFILLTLFDVSTGVSSHTVGSVVTRVEEVYICLYHFQHFFLPMPLLCRVWPQGIIHHKVITMFFM